MDFITLCFSSLYDTKKVEELCNRLKEFFMKLYQSHNSGNPNSAAKTSCMVQTSGISECANSISLDPFAQYKKMKASTQDGYGGQNEVERYFSNKIEMMNDNFDILKWWSLNWHRYPILCQIAKDILVIPVFTVASESTFSTGDRILDPFKSSLTPKTVESVICTQNWFRSTLFEDRIIEPTEEETEFYELVEAEFVRPMLAQQSTSNKEPIGD
ncbi:hypothetical protein WN944_010300 [Citrus x changshan-huyou]|uniref:HAT C-terminal dimerisation domain-containing protein n=1 Tax=Citrus x changshan-huyou TaxID=2935761 RepID=A0AAP0MTV1_9ROSI